MPLDQLPSEVLVQILQCLPFNDRVRVARVNRQFKIISEVAISRTKTFHLTAPIFRRIPLESMAKLIDLCSGSLQKVSFNDDWRFELKWNTAIEHDEYSSVLQERFALLLRFNLPRLSTIKLETFNVTLAFCGHLRQLLIKNPSVRTLEWNFAGIYFITSNLAETQLACKNLERVEFCSREYGIEFLPFFVNNCPNLKHLDLRFYFDQRTPISLRRLDSLTSLILDYAWHVPDEILRNISIFFPQLELLELSTKSDGITSRGLEYLENLQNLRDFKIVYRHNEDVGPDTSAMKLTRCKCLNIVQFRGYDQRLNSSTVQAFTRHCPQLRQLIVEDIRDIDSPDSASRFVLSLGGFVQQNFSIVINGVRSNAWKYKKVYGRRSKIWKCSKVKSAVAKINKSGNQLSIEIPSKSIDNKVENKWGDSPKRKRWYRKMISWIRRLFRK